MEKVNTRMIGTITQLDRSSWICMKCYADGIKEHAKNLNIEKRQRLVQTEKEEGGLTWLIPCCGTKRSSLLL